MILTCKTCGRDIPKTTDVTSRPCGHNTSAAIASMRAVAYGEAHFKQPVMVQYAKEVFDRIRNYFRK